MVSSKYKHNSFVGESMLLGFNKGSKLTLHEKVNIDKDLQSLGNAAGGMAQFYHFIKPPVINHLLVKETVPQNPQY